MMIALEDCMVRAAADKSSEALWTLSAGEVIEVLRTVTVPGASNGGSGSAEEGSEPSSTPQESEPADAGANSVERVFFSRPDLGLDGWVSASTTGADGNIRPLLEEFKGDSLTVKYEDVPLPDAEGSQQTQEPEAQGQTQKQLDIQQEAEQKPDAEPDVEPDAEPDADEEAKPDAKPEEKQEQEPEPEPDAEPASLTKW